MFEISFGEILIIGLVALIVLGPERLPTVARTLGALLGRAQRFVASVKADISQHGQMAGFDDLKKDVQDAANVLRSQIETEVAEVRQISYQIEQTAQQLGHDAEALLAETSRQIAPPEPEPAPPPVDDNQLDLFETLPPATPVRDNPVNMRE